VISLQKLYIPIFHVVGLHGGDGLQMWRFAANVLNIQLKTADDGWSSSLGVVRGANNFSP
jgi:hypothetical protein